jgi:glycosyltransferase involved in cell wall biosynthesis
LARTLAQLEELTIPTGFDWELLVVNNACTDHTDDVVEGFWGRLPIRLLWETVPGLSNAQNRAVPSARGKYILWTNDDVLVDVGWLAAYAAAFERWPDAAVFGGPIRPHFEGTPPAWLRRALPSIPGAYGVRDLGSDPIALGPGVERLPFGANYVVRKAEQLQHPFLQELGRRPGPDLIGGEEIQVMMAILADGHSGRWVPEAGIRHFVPRDRQTTRYVQTYYRSYGAQEAAALGGTGPPPGKRGHLLARVIASEARYRLRRITSKPDRWILDLKTAAVTRGHLRGF